MRKPFNIWPAIYSLVVVAIGIFLYSRTIDFAGIDGCLDRGGAWNYETRACMYANE